MSRVKLIAAGVIVHKSMSQDEKLKMHLVETGLCLRTVNTLESQGIHTVGQLLNTTRKELMEIANFGEKTLSEVLAALENIGFTSEPNQKKDKP